MTTSRRMPLPGDIPDGLLITPGHSFSTLTKITEALRHESKVLKSQAENMHAAVTAEDRNYRFVLGISSHDIKELLDAIATSIPNREAWSELHILDIFTPNLEDRKARTFQDSLVKACCGMLEEGSRVQAQTRDPTSFGMVSSCSRRLGLRNNHFT